MQGIEPPDSGKINIGDTVIFGNFSQQGMEIKDDLRLIEYVKSFAENFPLAKGGSLSAAQFLELFLFPPEKQFTYLSSLSGGEKKRLQLLTILFRNPNFLILDEPTNDLDLPTLSVLENFLSEFQGCVLIVSHDRYFMDRLVDHLFVFRGEGDIQDFPGNYTQYRIWEKEEEKKSAVIQKQQAQTAGEQRMPAPGKKKTGFKEKREFEQLEKEIPALEAEREALTNQMSDPEIDYEKIESISRRLTQIAQELEQKETRWLELSELI